MIQKGDDKGNLELTEVMRARLVESTVVGTGGLGNAVAEKARISFAARVLEPGVVLIVALEAKAGCWRCGGDTHIKCLS